MTAAEVVAGPRVDLARVRSFAGLVVGRIGPRAYSLISGTYLVLLVSQLTKSLLAVTFALTAHRLLSWAVYPVIGRLSDHSHSRMGKRTPYMAAGLGVMAVCTWFYPDARSYWVLVVLIIVARQARVAYSLPSIAATPEIFGRSRWIRALIAVGLGGLVVGLVLRVTIIATWEREDASTWPPAFRLAAVFMGIGALSIALLVREAPAVKKIREPRTKRWRDEVGEMLGTPNARAVAAAALLGIAASGATDRAYPVYAQEVLGASGSDLAIVGFTTLPTGIFGVVTGVVLARVLTRRQLARAMPVSGALFAILHIFATTVWQSVILLALAVPFVVASLIALGPFVITLIPRTGGIGERIGVLIGPIAVVGVLAGYVSALTYDHLVNDYRIIWVYAAIFSGLMVIPLARLKIPHDGRRTDLRVVWREVRSGMGTGVKVDADVSNPALFGGTVTAHDADATVFLDRLRVLAGRLGYDDSAQGLAHAEDAEGADERQEERPEDEGSTVPELPGAAPRSKGRSGPGS